MGRSLKSYLKKREAIKTLSSGRMSLAADIGEIPSVKNPKRRESCRLDLHKFLVSYFPRSTGLKPFSPDHRRVIGRLQTCILDGGRFVEAMYRGSAKTTIGENSTLWADLYGHRKFTPIFGADADAADGNIDSIKMELAENDLLYEDFPEVCHAVRALEGKPQRCASQTHEGRRTHIEWTADTIVLPTIRVPNKWETGKPKRRARLVPTVASGAIITAHGLTAASRGMKHKRPDGTQQRPDFNFIDDFQTDESAASPMQVAKRLGIIRKSILKLGGHGREMAVFVAGTVIARDDGIDQLLDPKRNPAWQGERIAMIRRWPDASETLWLREYARLRNGYDPNVIDDQKRAHREATEFYARNRPAMDAGGEVSWEHCFEPGVELSAIQHAYNMLIDDGPEVFASECQNAPLELRRDLGDFIIASASDMARRCSGVSRRIVPLAARHLAACIDVQETMLWWAVCAWNDDFTGSVIDYGAWPDQGREYFTLADSKKTMQLATGASSVEGAILEASKKLEAELLGVEWRREDGVVMRIARCFKDAGYKTSTVYQSCRLSPYAATLTPAKGVGIGPTNRPIEEYTRKRGERIGNNWMECVAGNRVQKFILIDTNWWKTFVHERLKVVLGDPGALTFFGKEPRAHQMLVDHLRSEYCTRTEGRGRVVHVFKIKPERPDNHLLDCIVGCAVAASMCGAILPGSGVEVARKRRRLTAAEIQQRRSA